MSCCSEKNGRQLISRDWVRRATSSHVATAGAVDDVLNEDSSSGYGYQFWMSRDGYRGEGAFEQFCMVYPEHDLVVAITAGDGPHGAAVGAVRDCLLPGLDDPCSSRDDDHLAARMRTLALPGVSGSADPHRAASVEIDASPEGSALPAMTAVSLDPLPGGWRLQLGPAIEVAVGFDVWRESSPLGRPVMATGAWQGDRFVADVYPITSPHRVRLLIDPERGTAVATWSTVPLTSPDLELHLRSPLMTQPDLA